MKKENKFLQTNKGGWHDDRKGFPVPQTGFHCYTTANHPPSYIVGMILAVIRPLFFLLTIILSSCGVPGIVATGQQLPVVNATPRPTPLPPMRFPQDEAAELELSDGLPFIHLAIVDEELFERYVQVFFGTDRKAVPKGMIEVVIAAPPAPT